MVNLSYCPINLNLKNGQWHIRLVRRTRTCATPLKTVCIDVFPRLKKIPSDVHSCLFCTITSRGRDDRFTCHLNWGATAICHITLKSHKRVFIVSNFYKMKKNLIQRQFYTKSNLLCLVCRHIISFLFAQRCIFHVRTWFDHHGL